MKTGWKYAVDDGVLQFVADPALTSKARRRLMDALRRIVDHPGQPADLLGYDAVGRPLSLIADGEFEVVFWVDHAAKEIRIVSIFRD